MRVFSLGGHTKHRREWNTRTVPGLTGFQKKSLKEFYFKNAKQPYWSCDLDRLNKILFAQLLDENWLQLASAFEAIHAKF